MRSTVHLGKLVVDHMTARGAGRILVTGVKVTSLLPGPTDTRFLRRADMEDALVARGPKDDPAVVARDGFEAMVKG